MPGTRYAELPHGTLITILAGAKYVLGKITVRCRERRMIQNL